MKYQSNFNNDLLDGQEIEKEISNIIGNIFKNNDYTLELNNTSEYDIKILYNNNPLFIECKYDKQAYITNNIAFEYEYKGNPSGIQKTKSNIIIYKLKELNEYIVLNTNILKKRIKEKQYFKEVVGGDNNQSKLYLFKRDMINKFSFDLHSISSIDILYRIANIGLNNYK